MVKVTERKNGFRVEIRVRLSDRTWHRERLRSPVSSRSASQRWGEARERDILTNGPKPPSEEVPAAAPVTETAPTLRVFWPRFIADGAANRQKASTLHAKETIAKLYLLPLLGDLPLDGIHNAKIATLKASLTKRSPKTANNVLTALSAALHLAVALGVLPSMPCKIALVKAAPPEMRFLEEAELDRLLAATADDARIVVLLAGDAGLRMGEIVALRWSDCDLARGLLHVRRSCWRGVEDSPKGGRGRTVPMTARLRAALESQVRRGDRVVTRGDGKPVNAPLVGRWLGTATERAGLPYAEGAHVLRHTFCSRLAMAGAPATAIQALAGHVNLSTTQRYLHLTPSAREGAIRLLDRGNPVARGPAEPLN